MVNDEVMVGKWAAENGGCTAWYRNTGVVRGINRGIQGASMIMNHE